MSPLRSDGFTLIELLIVVAIIAIVSATAIPLYEDAIIKTHRSALLADGSHFYKAMLAYQFDYDKFPSESDFDVATLDPLSEEGYYNGTALANKLFGEELLIYLAPDVEGSDTQFLAVGRSVMDPETILAVVYTNIIDETEGWVYGTYLITPEDLEEAGDDLDGGDDAPAEEEVVS
jgi:prepilin-type N-terminal cleavage/methylation domain-containing protein